MKMRMNLTLFVLAALTLGASLAVENARAADNVWLFNQTDALVKPCFMFSAATGWKDFGAVAPQNQFEWLDFRSIVQSELGLPSKPAEAKVRFTAISPFGPCPAPGAKVDEKTTFKLDGVANVYIFFGGHAIVRTLGQNNEDDGGDND